jgi:hypothetical protein
MRFNEFKITESTLKESEGGMMRRAEEAQRGKRVAFKNAAGTVIHMLNTEVFPRVGDSAENYNQLTDEISQFLAQEAIPEQSAHLLPPGRGLSPPETAGAALVMVFKDENQKKTAWIALKPKKKLGAYPVFMQTKLFSELTGYTQLSGRAGEEDKISGVQQRALTNLKPVGILPANQAIAVDAIPSKAQAALEGRDDLVPEIKQQVVQLLQAVLDGTSTPVPGAGEYAKSYEIDLGETAAPIALVKRNFLTGDWQEAQQAMMVDFAQAQGVIFPDDPAEKLYDSYLVMDKDTRIRISSKDKAGGAKASVSGVIDDINKNPERYEGLFDPTANPGFDVLLEVARIIQKPDMSIMAGSRFARNGSIAGALQLGVRLAVITQQQAERIVKIIDSDKQHLTARQLGDLRSLLQYKSTKDTNRPDYRIGWHLLAAVATEAANRINKDYDTDRFFKAVLERSNMLQIKTSLKTTPSQGDQGAGAHFSNFEVIYPPVFTGTIKLDPSSNFFATRRPVGKMGFSIK